MLKRFKENNPLIMFVIPLLIGITMLPSFLGFNELLTDEIYLTKIFKFNILQIVELIISFVCILLGALLIGIIFNRNDFHERNTFIAPVVYALSSVVFVTSHAHYGVHFSNLLIVLAIYFLLKSHDNEKWKEEAFVIGLILGLCSLISPAGLLMAPGFFIALLQLKGFRFRELVLFFLAFCLPYIYFFSFQYIKKGFISFDPFLKNVEHTYFSKSSVLEYSFYGVLFILVILGLLAINFNRYFSIKFKEKTRALISIFLLFIFATVILGLFNLVQPSPEHIIPFLSLIFSVALLNKRLGLLSNILLYSLFALYVCIFFF